MTCCAHKRLICTKGRVILFETKGELRSVNESVEF